MSLSGESVDRDDAGVRVRAAQHRAVQHARQVHVVHIQALAADEPLVLFAQHPAETRGHSASLECLAAQRTDLTMFS